jgi:hypothetical protein
MISRIAPYCMVWTLFFSLQCVWAAEQVFSPTSQPVRKGSFKGIEAALIKAERCNTCLSINRFQFQVKRKGKLLYSFALANETAQVDEVFPVNERETVVFGRVNANTAIVSRINNATGNVLQSFFCFNPSMSPDRRYVVFVKAYPNHFVEGETDEYLFLDLVTNKNEKGAVRAFYPPGAQNKPGGNVNVDESNRHHMVSSEFTWVRNDVVTFADKNQGSVLLILTEFRSGSPFIKAANLGSYRGLQEQCGLGEDAGGFRITSIKEDSKSARYIVRFDGVNRTCKNVSQVQILDSTMR